MFGFTGEGAARVRRSSSARCARAGCRSRRRCVRSTAPSNSARWPRRCSSPPTSKASVGGEGSRGQATVHLRSGVTGRRIASVRFSGERSALADDVGTGSGRGPVGQLARLCVEAAKPRKRRTGGVAHRRRHAARGHRARRLHPAAPSQRSQGPPQGRSVGRRRNLTMPTCWTASTSAVGKALRSGGAVTLLWAVAGGFSCQQTLGAGGKCPGPDAHGWTDVSDSSAGAASNDPGCPATWSEITTSTGYPATCTSNGLICTYPQGQAECAPDGSTLKWWTAGADSRCTETAPAVGAACGSPGLTCEYITGPPEGTFTTNYCCDGTRCAWALQGSNGCPNGNSCGSISTSDYDQSCTADSDCVLEPEGDFCQAICTSCAGGAINVKAQAQYEADPASKISRPYLCPCPITPAAVCNQGKCAR